MKLETYDGQCAVEFDDSPENKEAVFKRVIKFFEDTRLFSGESIAQSDKAYLEAPQAMIDIADDILKLKVTWREDL